MQNKIKFAVIGCGHIGKRHASMILGNDHFELVALCDVKPKDTLGVDAYSTAQFFSSIDELLASGLVIDAVAIASPNGYHEEHALKVLERNCHVVIEKPMALTKAGCEKIIFKALQKHKQVFCVMQNRYSPPSVWLKNVLDQGILGKIFMVQTNCYWNRDDRYYKPDPNTGKPTTWHGTKKLDGGTLFTQFSHFIDLMYWYFGDITNIRAQFNDFTHKNSTEFEDSGFVSFDFMEGGMGSLNYSTAIWDKNLESSITIIGEKGSIKVGGQYMNEVEYCHIKDYEMPELAASNPPNDYGPYKGSAANHHYIYENISDVINGEGSITTNALEGLKVVDIIERIYAS
ncbi:Gfo/Idh/MocA family protein [Pedobacter boryungensis]|uniref:Gfo/Idh/MocA family oxidoreductase n=1 Tax=Pedobacter boryungensis TaxID=869962 RepID=A0ABX2DFB1_9SPHI|nr:Gfo/Idh/MocA family oxidoreductase [Pedobacter boryungensis]NQX32735.1 Gfo/Idh/MocA family oxidoreductase [Pedobacter boryungensis]